MFLRLALALLTLISLARTAAAEWSLYDHLDRVLVYDDLFMREIPRGPQGIRGSGAAMLIPTAFPEKDGRLRPYAPGMEIQGQLRAGQMLLASDSPTDPTIAEFVVKGGQRLSLKKALKGLNLNNRG